MRTNRVLVTALIAGCACTAAHAQQNRVQVFPERMWIDGVEVPVLTSGGAAADGSRIAFDSLSATTNWDTAPGGNVLNALDDVQFDAVLSGPQDVIGMRVGFATRAVVQNPFQNVIVRGIWVHTIDPNLTPVNTSNGFQVDLQFAFPAAGWAADTLYEQVHFASFAQPRTVSAGGGFIYTFLVPTVNTPNTDFTPAYVGGGMTIGSSSPISWPDLNGNAIFEPSEATEVGTTAIPMSLAVALLVNEAQSPAGRCCLGSSCVILTSDQCASQVGVYGGDGTTCAAMCVSAPVLWNNGPIATGTVALNGFSMAPAGSQWSEAVRESSTGGQYFSNVAGFNANGAIVQALRVADDFTVPQGETWTVDQVVVYAYDTNNLTNPFNTGTVRIWSGRPDVAGSTIVYGDETTNRFASQQFANVYRIFNTAPSTNATNTARPVFEITLNTPGLSLPAGAYWIDYNLRSIATPWIPPVTVMKDGFGVYSKPVSNAMQSQVLSGTRFWYPIVETFGAVPGAVGPIHAITAELPFVIRGSTSAGSSCYANCDGSTQVPFLNVADFSCFLSKFAASDPYANCDGSTQPPILNVADFSCFLGKFAAGCSAP
jgi:hypothetical protein